MKNRFVTFATLAVGGLLLYRNIKGSRGDAPQARTLSTTHESIEVDVPIRTAYNQWTQFEDMPKFMDSVHEVRQLDDTHLYWRASIAGKEEEWEAEITEQIPDQRIAWRSVGGVLNSGVVTFHKLGGGRTRIEVHMTYQPRTAMEKIGGALGVVKGQTWLNLKRFKQLVESRGVETGAWRETVTHT